LASGTRVDVLKILDKRRHMQSEIATELNLSVPTVKEHLSALEKAGLVERFDEGRKWKYYALTKKGRGVLHPDDLKIFIVLGTFIIGVVGGIVSILRKPVVNLQTFGAESVPMLAKSAVDESAVIAERTVEPVQTVQSAHNYSLYIFSIVAVLSLIILAYLLYRRKYYMLGKSLSKK